MILNAFAGRRVVFAATALSLVMSAGCATSPGAVRQSTIVDENRNVYRATDNGVTISFSVPRDSAWKALLGAYGDVGLLPQVADTSNWIVARLKIPMRRVYNGMRTSALFSCGETAAGGSQADNGQIVASATSQLTAVDAKTTRVTTAVDAYVIPDGGTSSNSLHCGSTGEIETRLHKAIAARLGMPQFGS